MALLAVITVSAGTSWGEPPQRIWQVTRVGKSLDISRADVTRMLEAVERLFFIVDCRGDISCPISITMKDLDFRPRYSGIISRPQDLDGLHKEKNAFVLIVDEIAPVACTGTNAEGPGRILGCSGGDWMAVVRSPRVSPSIVWAHEFSHTAGNIHRNDFCALMRPSVDSEMNRAVDLAECTNIRLTPPPPAPKRTPARRKGSVGTAPRTTAPKSTAPSGSKTTTTTPTPAEDPIKRQPGR